uniref:HERV-H LTR-associating 2 n=1 Tax=Pavo cristatus TaxID=9049 RepID=A0A8C9LE82_PAVCR
VTQVTVTCLLGTPSLGFDVNGGVFGEVLDTDVILPCPFPPGNDEVIYWKKENKNVHSYYEQKDQLEGQDPDYRNRTHLFHENIGRGNASLKLSNVALTDEGLYYCYVGTEKDKTEMDVMLQVRGWWKRLHFITSSFDFHCMSAISLEHFGNVFLSCSLYNSIVGYRWLDQLSKAEGSSTTVSCEYSNNALHAEDFTVVWKLNKNGAISVLASFDGTFQTYQPRVQINQKNFSLSISDLNVDDSGDYVCNISTPRYTRLSVTTLQVGKLLCICLRICVVFLLVLCTEGCAVKSTKKLRELCPKCVNSK